MDSGEHLKPIAMPSRTIILSNVPAELNDEDRLRAYFRQFGTLLWVNAAYEGDKQAAIVTFFSIGDAIAAFICNEAILDNDSIKKSWFQYTKKCNLCPYEYSSSQSIERHRARCHTSKASAHLSEFGEKKKHVCRV